MPHHPTDAESRADYDRRPFGAWFHDFEDAAADNTSEPGPLALVEGDVRHYRRDELDEPE